MVSPIFSRRTVVALSIITCERFCRPFSALGSSVIKELQAIAFPGKKGRRFVDKLVQVRLRTGTDAWLLIHIEIEGRLRGRKALRIFAWRMIEYRHRIQGRIMAQHDR